MVIRAPGKNNENIPNEGAVYAFTLSFGRTWMEHKKVTASDGVSNEMFGWIISISGYTLLVGSHGKNGEKGSAYIFILAEDV